MASVNSLSVQPSISISAKRLLINNRWVPSESDKTFATINPSTGEVICDVAEADGLDVDKAVSAARKALERAAWRKMTASARDRIP